MIVFFLIFLVLSAICFALAALGKPVRDYNLIAAGLLFWVLVPLLQTFQRFL